MTLSSLRNGLQKASDGPKKRNNLALNPNTLDLGKAPSEGLFCPYQIEWLTRNQRISFDEKSRQIGWSFTSAFGQVSKAVSNQADTVYTAFNKDSTKQYIKDCTRWARVFNYTSQLTIKRPIIKERNVGIFELKFNNLRTIQAVSGSPENLRAKPGCDIILDEACYRKFPLEDILAAATAAIIHGGTIRVASTHAGIDSEFNQICEKIKKGDPRYKRYGHSRVSFMDAVNQGLYRKKCLYKRIPYDPKAEKLWVEEIYAEYPDRASEELDVIPMNYAGGNKIFNKNNTTIYPWTKNHEDVYYFRYHDLAVSEDANAYYSASVLVSYDTRMKKIFILNWYADHLAPLAGDEKIVECSRLDPEGTYQVIEQEPGPSGTKYVEGMKQRMLGKPVYGYNPKLKKIVRALPVGNAIAKRQLMVADSCNDKDLFIEIISKFDGSKQPLINDLVDCLSGVYDFIRQQFGYIEDEDTMRRFQNDDEGIIVNPADMTEDAIDSLFDGFFDSDFN